MASSKLGCDRITVERIERCVKRYGPIDTVRVRTMLGLSVHSAVAQLNRCPNVVCVSETHGGKVWAIKEVDDA